MQEQTQTPTQEQEQESTVSNPDPDRDIVHTTLVKDRTASRWQEHSLLIPASAFHDTPSPETIQKYCLTDPRTELPTFATYSSGELNAEVMVVAQSPGKEETNDLSALTGYTGQQCRDMLRRAGFKTSQLYFTNIYKHRALNPSTSKDDWKFHDEEFFQKYSWPLFLSELRFMKNLKLIITLGEVPLNALTGKRSVTKHRGSIYPLMHSIHQLTHPERSVLKVCPSLQPAILQYSPHMKFVIDVDFRRAKEELRSHDVLNHPIYDITYGKEVSTIVDTLREYKRRNVPCAVDTETYRPLEISCLSIAPNAKEVLSIELQRPNVADVIRPPKEELLLIRELDSFLTTAPTIMQNAMYDLFVFAWQGYTCPPQNLVMDTMLAHHCLWSELPHGLDFLCSMYTDQPYYKDEGKLVDRAMKSDKWQQYLEYNAKDSTSTYKCYEELSQELEDHKLWEFFREQYLRLLPALLGASLRGLPVSLKQRKLLKDTYNEVLSKVGKVLNEMVGYEINPLSPKQIHKYIYDELCIPKQYNPATGKVTADEITLRRMTIKYPLPQLRLIFQFRKLAKQLSPQYIDMAFDAHDVCIRTQFNIMGTVTGRLSGTTAPTGSGGTFQTFPREGLKLTFDNALKPKLLVAPKYVASENDTNFTVELPDMKSQFVVPYPYVLLCPDYKQAETYLVAHYARETTLVDLLFSGADIHKTTAAKIIYKKDISEVTKDERYLAKRTGHAANYGMGPRRFMDVLAKDDVFLPMRETRLLLSRYHDGYPNIRRIYHKEVREELIRSRRLYNFLGRMKWFLGRLDDDTFRSAYSFKPQSGVSDLLNRALIIISDHLPICGQQHDSLWALSHIDDIEKNITLLCLAMQIQVIIGNYEFYIPNDMKYGPSIGALKEIDVTTKGEIISDEGIDRRWIVDTQKRLSD